MHVAMYISENSQLCEENDDADLDCTQGQPEKKVRHVV